MIAIVNKNNFFSINLGSSKTGYTVSYRLLSSTGVEVSTWSTSGVVEIGNGLYGLSVLITNASIAFIQWKAEKESSTTYYSIDAVTVVRDWTADILNILKIETGRWVKSGTVLTFYDEDGTTPLYQFNILDSGNERAPV